MQSFSSRIWTRVAVYRVNTILGGQDSTATPDATRQGYMINNRG